MRVDGQLKDEFSLVWFTLGLTLLKIALGFHNEAITIKHTCLDYPLKCAAMALAAWLKT